MVSSLNRGPCLGSLNDRGLRIRTPKQGDHVGLADKHPYVKQYQPPKAMNTNGLSLNHSLARLRHHMLMKYHP